MWRLFHLLAITTKKGFVILEKIYAKVVFFTTTRTLKRKGRLSYIYDEKFLLKTIFTKIFICGVTLID